MPASEWVLFFLIETKGAGVSPTGLEIRVPTHTMYEAIFKV
jgi:hypothetical protein